MGGTRKISVDTEANAPDWLSLKPKSGESELRGAAKGAALDA